MGSSGAGRRKNQQHLWWAFVATVCLLSSLPYWMLQLSEQQQFQNNTAPKISERKEWKARKPTSLSSELSRPKKTREEEPSSTRKSSCAVLFFGLPRSFESIVLPSIRQNVLIPNRDNHCDFFMHYYNVSSEAKSRIVNGGGNIDTSRVPTLLTEAVHQVDPEAHVSMISDTDESFWKARKEQLDKYRTVKAADGKYLYYPWMAKTFTYPTSIDNIVKQWHSIDAVWNLMEKFSASYHQQHYYERVAMLRNDAVYMTPFDIYRINNTLVDRENQYASIPNWARYPVNDRMIYGNRKAVKIWATRRFELLEDHVRTYNEPGYGMHSERFLEHSIFPAIRNETGIPVVNNPDICFLRARADGAIWANDCASRAGAATGFRVANVRLLLEQLLGRPCVASKKGRVLEARCDGEPTTSKP